MNMNIDNYSNICQSVADGQLAGSFGFNVNLNFVIDPQVDQIQIFQIYSHWIITDNGTGAALAETGYSLWLNYVDESLRIKANNVFLTGANLTNNLILVKGWNPVNMYVNNLGLGLDNFNIQLEAQMAAALAGDSTCLFRAFIYYKSSLKQG